MPTHWSKDQVIVRTCLSGYLSNREHSKQNQEYYYLWLDQRYNYRFVCVVEVHPWRTSQYWVSFMTSKYSMYSPERITPISWCRHRHTTSSSIWSGKNRAPAKVVSIRQRFEIEIITWGSVVPAQKHVFWEGKDIRYTAAELWYRSSTCSRRLTYWTAAMIRDIIRWIHLFASTSL